MSGTSRRGREMKRPICYPSCEYLDPDNRDASGRMFCERRVRYVEPARTVYKHTRFRANGLETYGVDFDFMRCAPDCRHRRGKTRRATF